MNYSNDQQQPQPDEFKTKDYQKPGESSSHNSFEYKTSNVFETTTSNYNSDRGPLIEHVKDENPIMLPNQSPNIDIIFPPSINYEDIKCE